MGPGERAPARIASLVAGALAAACASGPVVASGEGWRHRELGYSVDAPAPGAGPWRRIRVEGADLAFRGPHGETLSLLSRCTETKASPRIEARHLVIGLDGARPLASGPISLGGAPGWAQSFELRDDGVLVRLHSVTLVQAGCTFDWIFSARAPGSGGALDEAGFAADLRSFDSWWRSFRWTPPAPAQPEEGGA
jgi:hypothetical protein